MPPYDWISLESLFIMLAVGTGLTLAIILARGSFRFSLSLSKRTDQEIEQDVHDFGDGLTEGNRPLPLFIWLILVGTLVWSIGYVIHSGLNGI